MSHCLEPRKMKTYPGRYEAHCTFLGLLSCTHSGCWEEGED